MRADPERALQPIPVYAAAIHAHRQPAGRDFLERRRLAIDYTHDRLGVPAPWSGRWVIVTCRAELAWAEAEWRQLDPLTPVDRRAMGPHPAEAYRLAHEQAAARVLNAWDHLHPTTTLARNAKNKLKLALKAARDMTQGQAYRDSWAEGVVEMRAELALYRDRRHRPLQDFIAAIAAYRAQRALIGAPTEAAALEAAA